MSKILATHTYIQPTQRYEFVASNKTLYNQDLVQKLLTEYDGHILDVILYLFWPTEKMYAREFHDAMHAGFGLGHGQWSNNKDTIRDIFCKKSFYELSEILVEYERQNGHKIDEDIETEFSGDVKKTLLAIGK
ncbi:hypothetical protein HA402_013466 [Bradysia odoriphaga]|nr:hypothetical protein HA402_013466 [Bradysia odoriphaga]